MTIEERQQLRDIEAKATALPWVHGEGHVDGWIACAAYHEGVEGPICTGIDRDDREIIVAARNSLIPLLDALDAQEKRLAFTAKLLDDVDELLRDCSLGLGDPGDAECRGLRDRIFAWENPALNKEPAHE